MLIPDSVKGPIDAVSLGTIFFALLDRMPNIAAFVALIWTLIRIYETETCKRFIRWLTKRKKG